MMPFSLLKQNIIWFSSVSDECRACQAKIFSPSQNKDIFKDWEAKRLLKIHISDIKRHLFSILVPTLNFGRSNCKITNPTVLLLFEKNFCHVKDIITPTTYTFLALSPIWQTKNIDFAKKYNTPTSRSLIYFLTHSRVEF